jgi:hypothetical protein
MAANEAELRALMKAPPAAFRSVFVGMKTRFVGILATPAERAGVNYFNGLD